MLSQRAAQLDPALRKRLFAVAAEAFGRHGYERGSLNTMLAAAEVPKSTFFYYFRDKEDLFASVLEDALARVAAAAGPLILPETPKHFWREATDVLERWGVAAASEPGFVALLRALQPLRRTASARLHRAMDESRAVGRALIARGVELGVVRGDFGIDTLVALTDAIDLVLDDEFHRNPSPDADALAAHRERVFDLVHRLLRP